MYYDNVDQLIEQLKLKFTPDTQVYLFVDASDGLYSGEIGTVLHQDHSGIFVYFKINGKVRTEVFDWDRLATGILRTKEEITNIKKSAVRNLEFTSALVELRSEDGKNSKVSYIYGFANSDMLTEFISMVNRKHWSPVIGGDGLKATALAKFKPTSEVEIGISTRTDIETIITDFKSVITRLRQLQSEGMRPDVDIKGMTLCWNEASDYLSRHRKLMS
ncbi:hypothetical protein LIS04_43 [Listeria phage LIS04]|nr:hypothetical protein LIS04_43 [Listeria phage LIS04]